MPKKKDKGINSELETNINQLMSEVMTDPNATITDKMKVIDRALKLEALKAKFSDDEWGMGFLNEDDDEV
jgi:hypothetical protein